LLTVCSITHGAILLAANPVGRDWLTAREEWIAPIAVRVAAKTNNKQKIRRLTEGVRVEVEFWFGFIL
jgi:hypothetical protein